MNRKSLRLVAVATVLFVGAADMAAPVLVQAQGRICQSLWYERNEIYARNGYCFKTERARATFGAGCFPPYGRLSYGEKQRVDEIQAEEDARGCPR